MPAISRQFAALSRRFDAIRIRSFIGVSPWRFNSFASFLFRADFGSAAYSVGQLRELGRMADQSFFSFSICCLFRRALAQAGFFA
jgi:hypothetical protein